MNQKVDNAIGGCDDAPELTQKWFDKAHVYKDGKLVKRGEGEPPFEEIGLEMKRAANSRLRGDSELPTRNEVVEAAETAYDNSADKQDERYCCGGHMEAAVDALIARGWLRVREATNDQ